MITANYFHSGPPSTDPSKTASGRPRKQGLKAVRDSIAVALMRIGGTVTSRSGWTASLAVNHCEVRGYSYTLTSQPGLGYTVQRIEKIGA